MKGILFKRGGGEGEGGVLVICGVIIPTSWKELLSYLVTIIF